MGLHPHDPKPTEISIRDAYNAIRAWYQANTDRIATSGDRELASVLGEWRMPWICKNASSSLDLVDVLPEQDELSDLEIRAVLAEVIAGKLEWAYHASDGSFKMAAYAHAALKQAGLPILLSSKEKQLLKDSALYPYLSKHLRE